MLFSHTGYTSSLDFIYINSSVDEAAGGHTAVRFEDSVFHFQYYDEGYFLLVKDTWDEFRYQYNDLQNRTLYIATIQLEEDIFRQVKQQFNTRFLIQEQRFNTLEKLKVENNLFNTINSQDNVGILPLSGLGFFDLTKKQDPFTLKLHSLIDHHLGPSFLVEKFQQLYALQQQLKERIIPTEIPFQQFDLYQTSFHNQQSLQQYCETLRMLVSLKILLDGNPLQAEAVIQSMDAIEPLNEVEQEQLVSYRQRLINSVIAKLSNPQGWDAHALLVEIARFNTLSSSIKNGRLVTIEPFSSNTDRLNLDTLRNSFVLVPEPEQPETDKKTIKLSYFQQLHNERLRDAKMSKDVFFSMKEDQDIAYTMMEKALGELQEFSKISDTQKYIRLDGSTALPDRKANIAIDLEHDQSDIDEYRQQSAHAVDKMNILLLETYGYNLFNRNCVTELFETIYSTFSSQQEAREKLGGYLTPGESFSFVPFQSFNLVAARFDVESIEVYPSYRLKTADKLYEETGFWSLVEESNTLTSSIYQAWDEDSIFLFFTDDTIWLRPIFGISNLLYGAIGTIGGILNSPVDDGLLLKRSVKGMVFSLPEITFINIRKGTFPSVGKSD